jgi:hypothetical protein
MYSVLITGRGVSELPLWPQVLILHLKRFTFDMERGPLKVTNGIEYPAVLELPEAVLSSALKGRVRTQRGESTR